ncbi:PSD1 and planctomycete cytochrome C domain-containing protein [Opitutaceae bacterium]|nr:PSD1 and planctomycete cytochrome C domain-containing protein [Opitutaceae bacterium]
MKTQNIAIPVFSLLIAASVPAKVDFNREIRPILSENCFRCHGPDEDSRKGGSRANGHLRLDTAEGAQMDLGDYAAIAPGNPDESELLYLVSSDDPEERMPPPKEGNPLSEEQIALLSQWIKEGGNYDTHWAYQKPIRPEVPEVSYGDFRLDNPIDHFVVEKLVSNHASQSPEADQHVLARRVSLDLVGLPPSAEEVEAFLQDAEPNAYTRYVERILDKASYGEHWARMWLDLARYADSAGYADDPPREIWGFRDYVIRSFNENKPFDQFTIEQIAGDLLNQPTLDQRVATAFHRNTKTNSEGGTIDEEFRNEAVVDRVNTTMAVWMGTTIDCAQCHTHKYDPITQEEYFRMFAIFNNTADEDRKDEEPILALFSEVQKQKRAQIESAISIAQKELEEKLAHPDHRERREQWEQNLHSRISWQTLRPEFDDMTAVSKAPFSINSEGVIEIADNARPQDTYTIKVDYSPRIQEITAIRLEVLPDKVADLGTPSEWVLNEFEIRRIGAEQTQANDSESDSDEKEASPPAKSPKLKLFNATASFEQEWYPVDTLHDGIGGERFSGWAVKGSLNTPHEAVLEFASRVELGESDSLEIRLIQNFPDKKIKRFRISVTHEADPFPAVPLTLATVLAKQAEDRSAAEEKELLDFFAQHDPGSARELSHIAQLREELNQIRPTTTVPVMRQVADEQRRQTHIQYRGSYFDKGPEVSPGTPAVFHPLPQGETPDRLDLAKWLVDTSNPLTARVIANRYWEALFGFGIVATSEEFGSQGELPSHPELLDWLAVELMESGWDIKRLLKLMVTSATYRQSSKVTPATFERDPDNRLLARGPRFRVSAETVRDQALAVSGLLSDSMFGPSVNPPQPDFGLKAAFGGKTDWTTSEGPDRYRRGIYTSWRRSNPYPSMAAFDAPNREVCIVRRDNTNTPLQALVTLNDPVYIEASQGLGRKMESFAGDLPAKIRYGFQECLVRPPSEKEVQALSNLFFDAQRRYQQDPEKALAMATDPIGDIPEGSKVADLAAWAVLGNTLLNLDEMFLKP